VADNRRLEWQIYLDIICVISESRKKPLKLSPVANRSGVSYDKCKVHLKQLEHFGLLQMTPEIKLTEKGWDYMHKFGQLQHAINLLEEYFLK